MDFFTEIGMPLEYFPATNERCAHYEYDGGPNGNGRYVDMFFRTNVTTGLVMVCCDVEFSPTHGISCSGNLDYWIDEMPEYIKDNIYLADNPEA